MQWVVEGLEDVARPEKPQLASAPVKPVERADAGEKETLKEKKKRKKKKKVVIDQLSAEEMAEFTAEQERRGIVYISRVPPFMKPDKIRRELSQFGTVMRIFLTPEARSSHLKRKRFRGNSKIKYVDGWVEFDSKKDAKMVVRHNFMHERRVFNGISKKRPSFSRENHRLRAKRATNLDSQGRF